MVGRRDDRAHQVREVDPRGYRIHFQVAILHARMYRSVRKRQERRIGIRTLAWLGATYDALVSRIGTERTSRDGSTMACRGSDEASKAPPS